MRRRINKLHLFISILACYLNVLSPAYAHSALNTFIAEILENNPAIQAAAANVAAAEARERAAGYPLYNPELTAERQNAIENTTSVGLNQTIDWANKRVARAQVGAANARAATVQLANLQQQTTAQILSALADYEAKQQVVSLAKKRTALLQQFVKITRKRYHSGDIARIDLDLAQLAYSEAIAQQADAEVNANQTLQVLRAVTGMQRLHWPKLNMVSPPLQVSDHEIERWIQHLPAFMLMNQEFAAACARLKLATRERYPDPTIGIQGGESTDGAQRKALIGVTFSVPLFIRNSYKAEADAANFDSIAADEKRKEIYRQVKSEMKSSAERYQTLYHATQLWHQIASKPLGDGMSLIERLWQAGEITATDYIVQLKQRVDSQVAGVELKGRAFQAWVAWLKASGQINCWLHLSVTYQGEQSCA